MVKKCASRQILNFFGIFFVSILLLCSLLYFCPEFILQLLNDSLQNSFGPLDFIISLAIIALFFITLPDIWKTLLDYLKTWEIIYLDIVIFSIIIGISFVLFGSLFTIIEYFSITIFLFMFAFSLLLFLSFRVIFAICFHLLNNIEDIGDYGFLDDQAINTLDKDLLGRIEIINNITRAIKLKSFNNSMIYAITGKWGIGKTSILNIVREKLKSDNIVIINFSPWLYVDNKSTSSGLLTKRFFEQLGKVLYNELHIFEITLSLNKLYKIISPAIKNFPLNPELFFKSEDESFDQLKNNIGYRLQKSNKRIIVFIDDLDIMDNNEILEIFRLIRFCLDIDNVDFLVSFDKEHVQEELKKVAIYPDKYIQKFIQIEFAIPESDPDEIENLFTTYLQVIDQKTTCRLFEDLDFKNNHKIIYEAVVNWLDTPRTQKLFINRYLIAQNFLQNEVNNVDLLLLLLIQFKYPNAYKFIYDNPQYFMDTSRVKISGQSSAIKSFLENYFHNDDIAINILRVMFKTVDDYYQETKTESFGQAEVSFIDHAARIEKGISEPEYFSKYFLFKASHGDIADTIWDELLLRIKDGAQSIPEFISSISKMASTFVWTRKLSKSIRHNRFSDQYIEELFRYLSKNEIDLFIDLNSNPAMLTSVAKLYSAILNWAYTKDEEDAFLTYLNNIYVIYYMELYSLIQKQQLRISIADKCERLIRNLNVDFDYEYDPKKTNIFEILRLVFLNEGGRKKEISSDLLRKKKEFGLISLIYYLSPQLNTDNFQYNFLNEYIDPKEFLSFLYSEPFVRNSKDFKNVIEIVERGIERDRIVF